MKCHVRTENGTVTLGGVKIDSVGVTCEETPEILYYISMGWLVRVAAEPKPEATPVEADGPAKVVKRKKSEG